MSFQEITALVAAWQAGAISQDTMFDLFSRRVKVIAPGRTMKKKSNCSPVRKQRSRRSRSKPPVVGGNEPQPLNRYLIYGPKIQIRKRRRKFLLKHQSLYVERDGAWLLDADGVVDKSSTRISCQTNIALANQLKRFEGIDPDAVRQLAEDKRKLEERNS